MPRRAVSDISCIEAAGLHTNAKRRGRSGFMSATCEQCARDRSCRALVSVGDLVKRMWDIALNKSQLRASSIATHNPSCS
eukprot:1653087-Amphidinium_carterae.2